MRIGVLGAGQLGRMLALAGYPLGLEFLFLDPIDQAPTDGLAERIKAPFDDRNALDKLAAAVDVVTYEFENVPVGAARHLATWLPVFPPPEALDVAQDRLAEKTMFRRLGIPTPAFAPVSSHAELVAAAQSIGLPAVLKTRRLGYDGKGQRVLRHAHEIDAAWQALGNVPLILEAFVPFTRELSVLAVRSRSGPSVFYPLVENEHRGGILHRSLAPAANLSAATTQTVDRHASDLLDALHYVGVLAIEFFELDGELLANEMAPRVHNSGHWTMDGAETCQFENHLRAILGWPLGGTEPLGHAAMLNLVGSVPSPSEVLSLPGAHLHLYAKEPRRGRKLGHVNVRADEPRTLTALVQELERIIERTAESTASISVDPDGITRAPNQ